MPIDTNILERIKVDLKKICFSSYDNYQFDNELNITNEELNVLKSLAKRDDIIIQKADKGNSVVILNKCDYTKRMNETLSDQSTFKKLDVTAGKELNILLQQEDRLITFLKKIKNSISYDLYKSLYPQGSQPGILYGLSKIHKPLVDKFPKLRPILSALNTSTYKWAKFFVPVLKDLTCNNFTIKDSFEFAKNITEQDSRLFMASLDIDSLFTNVPLDETINLCINELFKCDNKTCGMSKTEMFEMLSLTTKESIILYDNSFYSQIDGVSMGSPLGPTLANAFLCHHEKQWLNDCPKHFKPVYYKRYVDDIIVLFESPEHVPLFANYLNSKHKKLKFTFETENNGKLPFLDINIFREKGKFVTTIYRKDTFSGVYTNFNSFLPLDYKFGLVFTLLHRCFSLVSDLSKFHLEVESLKQILLKNEYSEKFIDTCIYKFLNKLFIEKVTYLTVPKKELYIVLPFLGKSSSLLKTRLIKSLQKQVKFCKVKVIFKTTNRLKHFFRFKDKIPETLRSSLIYKFTCGSCNASYIGKTFRHMKVRVSEHRGVSPRTGKALQGTMSTSVRDHMLTCDHRVVWEDFSVLGNESNNFLLELKESLFIKRDKPQLNKNIASRELFLF